jgi:nucleoid-associated protein YgaU
MNKNFPPPPHQGSPPPLPLPPHQRHRRTPPGPPPFPTPAVALARDAALATAATAAAAAANAVPAIPPRPVADAISNAFLDRTNARSGVSLNGRLAASFHRVKNAVLKNYEGTVTDEEFWESKLLT